MNYVISQAGTEDYAALGTLMFKAVREGSSLYTDAQRQVWTPQPRDGSEWNARLSAQYVLKAAAGGAPIGFMSLRNDGYVDFAYILHSARGKGLFRKLYVAIEKEAAAQRHTQLSTHASLMAMPAFTAMGFEIVQKETVAMGSEKLERFEMSKPLSKG